MKTIKSVTVITAQGVSYYSTGLNLTGKGYVVGKITIDSLYFEGNPYEHYFIYDNEGNLRVTISCLAPCEVEYLIDNQ